MGKPVVGCRAGGMPEIIEDGGNGFMVTPSDVTGLSIALDRLICDPSLRERMGARGREIFLERFTAERMASGSAALLDAASANFTRRGP